MRTALAALAVLSAALAGCSDGHSAPEPVVCPDGTTLTPEQVEALPGHHDEGFDPSGACPVAPSVRLEGVPASLQAFASAPFRWTLDNGTVPHAHSMLTAIRWSRAAVADTALAGPETYPEELIKREHQDLPITYRGNLSFAQAGTVYLRAYMEVAGEHYWSGEVALDVTPVLPTGTVHDVVVPPAAGVAGDPEPVEVAARLGDAIRLDNQDVLPHTCAYDAGPGQTDPLSAEAQAQSEPVALLVPGLYEYVCDTLQPTGFRVNVQL